MDELFGLFCPSEDDILSLIDDYALYCAVLGYEPMPGKKYQSPVRQRENEDLHPSFSLFAKGPVLCWFDHGLNRQGDVFTLIGMLNGMTDRIEILRFTRDKIISGAFIRTEGDIPTFSEEVESTVKVKSRAFTRRELEWYAAMNIQPNIMKLFNHTAIDCYWRNGEIRYCNEFAFAYRIGERYQIYQPRKNKEFKFRNNWDVNCVPGWAQLPPTGDLCVITKSIKDIECLHSFGYPAIGPRGEWKVIPDKFLRSLETRFKRIIILFDNDGKHNGDLYPYPQVFVPISSGKKDPTDYCLHYGIASTATMLKSLLT